MKRFTILLLLLASLASCGKRDWKDASLPATERAKALLKEMTLEEKVGQMCQYVAPCYVPPGQGSPYKNIDATDENLGNKDLADKIRRGEVGSFLHCMTTKEAIALQELAKESRLGIPLLIGIDAIHGNALIEGCTIYPTSINLASTFDADLAEKIGTETALEMRQKGLYWTFAPNLDVARDARWGRMGETFGEDPFLVSEMGKYSIWGLQGRNRNFDEGHVIACAKHLIAGGEPFGGLNAAPMDLSERQLREIYLPPFVSAVQDAHVGTVMAAHNEVNGIPCHGNSWLLKDLLRNELGFDGFVVSDWMDIERLHAMHHWAPDSTEAFVRSVEAGIDMHMQGDNYFEAVIGAVKSGRIPMKRIDEAVGKILEMKFAVGLFEAPLPSLAPLENAEAHRQTALDAVRESIVLLKNNGILPLTSEGLASPDRSHPRLVRGRGPLAERVGGAERSEESGLSEPDASFEVVLPKKNGAGGVNGGITNGAPIVFRVAFKPTSSIAKTQRTLNTKTGETVDLNVPGRHDVCFALRTPVIVEAVAAIVLADLLRCQDTVLPRL